MSPKEQLLTILCDYWKIPPSQIQSISIAAEGAPISVIQILAPFRLNVILGDIKRKRKPDFIGKAKGIQWEAGLPEGNQIPAWILYPGPLENLLTPTKIPKILDKIGQIQQDKAKDLEAGEAMQFALTADELAAIRASKETTGGLEIKGDQEAVEKIALGYEFGALWQPHKAFAIMATTDKESGFKEWEEKRINGAARSRNPIIQSRMKGTTLRTFFDSDRVQIQIGNRWEYPESVDDLRAYVAAAFKPESYAAMLALSYLSDQQSGKQRFSVRVPDLCKLIFGTGYNTKQRERLMETMSALQNASLHMITPHKTRSGRKDEIEHIFTPLLISKIHWKNGIENGKPEKIDLILWPQAEGKERNFTTAMVPESVFKLKQKDFPLYSYLMIEKAHHERNGKAVKIQEEAAMRAANLDKVWKSNPRVARSRLKAKLKRMTDLGIIGELQSISPGEVILKKLAGAKKPDSKLS